jgi:hypothetical protein
LLKELSALLAEYVGAVVLVVPHNTLAFAQRISIYTSPVSLRSKTGVESEPRKPMKLLISIGRSFS